MIGKNLSIRFVAFQLASLLLGSALTFGCDSATSGSAGGVSTGSSGDSERDKDTEEGRDVPVPVPEAPVGADLVSSSTNMSSKQDETSPKLSPYAGAAFVQAPQINNYGSVSLAYQMEIPQGRAGLQPSVGLSYSSSGGDGLVGIGWSLGTGLGTISRTTRHGQLYYDHRDTFTFNGKRLVKVEGPKNSEDGVYRLEIESGFSKFIMEDAENGGVWRVIDKAGTVTYFGADRSSRIYHPDNEDQTYIWNFVESVDQNGNRMSAWFDSSAYEANHIIYLKEIRYTGNDRAGLDARQYVRFHYTNREDAYVSKAPGFVMKMDRLLESVEVGWDDPEGASDTTLWRYTMVYETSKESGRPLLVTVDSTRNTTKPEFLYGPAVHNLVWQKVENPSFNDPEVNPDATQYFEGDFNGDGLSDMVFFNPETGDWKAAERTPKGGYAFKSYGNRFAGYDGPSKIQWFKGNVTGDYNGDGRSDIAFYLPETREFWVAEHDGLRFQFRLYGRQALIDLDIMKCEWFPGDYDGNGLSDAVLFNEPTGEWILMTNEGGSFEFVKFGRHFQNLFRDDYAPNANFDSAATFDTSEFGKDRDKVVFLNGDFSGDGRTDISVYDTRSGNWFVGENHRRDSLGFRLEWRLYQKFDAPEQALMGHDRFSGDFNGDGFSDFLLFNRETNEWIIGETKEKTIHFRVFSKMPFTVKITRWLQGDFNGDGRTDIGFFSETDNNFWVGEATQDGFRYRVYNNLSYGPDPDEVMRTPLPKDEVKLADAAAVWAQGGRTRLGRYKYDANLNADRGERVFAGNWSETTGCEPDCPAELLIYKRREGSFYLKAGTDEISKNPVLTGVDLGDKTAKLLGGGAPVPYRDGKDALVYYEKTDGYDGSEHRFYAISKSGAAFKRETIATVRSPEDVVEFDPQEGFYLLEDFDLDGTSSDKQLLVVDYKGAAPRIVLFDKHTSSGPRIAAVDERGDFRAQDLRRIAQTPRSFRLFAGRFTSALETAPADVLLVDTTGENHAWYLGSVTDFGEGSAAIAFRRLDGDVRLASGADAGQYRVFPADMGADLVYAKTQNGAPAFYKLRVTGDRIEQVASYTAEGTAAFKSEYSHDNAPIVHGSNGPQKVILESGRSKTEALTEKNAAVTTVDRPDLIDQVYKFRWIQGDYNGDGKTDVGIFHLKERQWYFAVTQGTVPDMIHKVRNGIGGIYELEYVNSSSFDNTGGDEIPDLPMNYKVCSKLTVDDGLGRRIATKYEYSDGYAFSAFINGYKETDYFGFGTFKTIDSLGNRTISTYYNAPYDDFRKNRALAGAIKENRFLGSDHKEYSKTEYDYRLHEIRQTATRAKDAVSSFLIEPVEVRKYMNGRLVQTTRSSIELTPNEYEMVSKRESVTDHYEDGLHAPATVTSYTEFDNLDDTNEMRLRLKKTLDGTKFETTTSYKYDNRGNVLRETVSYNGGGLQAAPNRVVEYEYDVFGNRTAQTNLSDPRRPRMTEKTYDSRLFQFPIEERAVGDEVELATSYVINYGAAFGQAQQKIDPNGNSTYFEFDSYGRLNEQLADIGGNKELLVSYSYNTDFPMSGKVIQHTGSGGGSGGDVDLETRTFADGMGRTIHAVRSAGDEPGRRYTKTGMLVYDTIGRVIRKSQTDWAGDDEIDVFRRHKGEKHPTVTEYDASGRVKKVTLPRGYEGEDETSISYEYNDPWETVETHSVGRGKRTVKNGRGQVLYVEDFGTGDDGKALSASIGFYYDLSGKRIAKFQAEYAKADGQFIASDVEKILAGHEDGLKTRAPIPEASYWWYDGLGQVIEAFDPDMGRSRMTYNAFGDVVETVDANGKRTVTDHDSLGRPTVTHLPDGEGEIVTVYDELEGSENALGQVVMIQDPAQTKTFSYDELGRVKREVREIHADDLQTYTTDYAFDNLNRKTEITYPQNPQNGARMTVRYAHGPMGVKGIDTELKGKTRPILTEVSYNEFGQMDRVVRGNETTTEYIYDIKGRLQRLRTSSSVDGAPKMIQDVSYEFKVDNSIASVMNSPELDVDGAIESAVRYEYTYDGLNRLVEAFGDYQKSGTIPVKGNSGKTVPVDVRKQFKRGYDYALNGNMMGKTIYDPQSGAMTDQWSYIYEGNNHAVTGITTTGFGEKRFDMQYDAVGNMVAQWDYEKDLAKHLEYDSSNRIRKVTDPDTGELKGEYEYDSQGFRVRKYAPKKTKKGEVFAEILYPSMYFGVEKDYREDGGKLIGVSSVNNIYLNGVRIAAIGSDKSERHYYTDQVDSVKVVADGDGRVVTRMEYLPYGETWWQEGDEDNRPKYNSQEWDEETGFYFYNARHYDPEIARFVTADSVVPEQTSMQSWNRFSYVRNNPIIYKDPTGHKETSMWEKVKTGAAQLFESTKRTASQTFKETKNLYKKTVQAVNDKTQEFCDYIDEKSKKPIFELGEKTYNVIGASCGIWGSFGNLSFGGQGNIPIFIETKEVEIFGTPTGIELPTSVGIGFYFENLSGIGQSDLVKDKENDNRYGHPQNALGGGLGPSVFKARGKFSSIDQASKAWSGKFNNVYAGPISLFYTPSNNGNMDDVVNSIHNSMGNIPIANKYSQSGMMDKNRWYGASYGFSDCAAIGYGQSNFSGIDVRTKLNEMAEPPLD